MNNVKWSSDQQDRKTHPEGEVARHHTNKEREDHPDPTEQTRGRQWSTQDQADGDKTTPPPLIDINDGQGIVFSRNIFSGQIN